MIDGIEASRSRNSKSSRSGKNGGTRDKKS